MMKINMKNSFVWIIVICSILIYSCKENKEEVAPNKSNVSIKTKTVTDITSHSAITGGSFTISNAVSPITKSGVVFSNKSEPNLSDIRAYNEDITKNDFSMTIDGLDKNTTYFVRAFALTQNMEVFFGDELSFTTNATLPIVLLNNISTEVNVVTIKTKIKENGGTDIIRNGVVISKDKVPTIEQNSHIVETKDYEETDNTFEVSGLSADTEYYVRAFAYNSVGVSYSEQKMFRTKKEDKYKGETVEVEGGEFNMGSKIGADDAKTVHKVKLNSFKITKTEITTSEFVKFLNSMGTDKGDDGNYWILLSNKNKQITKNSEGVFIVTAGKEKEPVTFVSHFGASEFAKWIDGRLPTEAEWEYAARGGNKTKRYLYSGGDKLDEVAWYYKNTGGFLKEKIQNVAGKKPNELGIYDMSGNAREWCSDWYHTDFYSFPEGTYDNPQGPKNGTYKCVRGGAYDSFGSALTVYARWKFTPKNSHATIGFRVVFDK